MPKKYGYDLPRGDIPSGPDTRDVEMYSSPEYSANPSMWETDDGPPEWETYSMPADDTRCNLNGSPKSQGRRRK